MAKILLTISTISILAFIVVAMYCAMIVAGRSDENENKGNSNEGDDDMFGKKQICPRCKTGKYTYELDPKSEACPYIGCWKCNKCHFYKPLEKISKAGKNDVTKKQQEYHEFKNNFLESFFCKLKNN